MKKILTIVKFHIFFTQIHRLVSKKIYTFVANTITQNL